MHAAQSHMHGMSSYINVINKNANYITPALVDKQTHRHMQREWETGRGTGRGKEIDHGKIMQVYMLS